MVRAAVARILGAGDFAGPPGAEDEPTGGPTGDRVPADRPKHGAGPVRGATGVAGEVSEGCLAESSPTDGSAERKRSAADAARTAAVSAATGSPGGGPSVVGGSPGGGPSVACGSSGGSPSVACGSPGGGPSVVADSPGRGPSAAGGSAGRGPATAEGRSGWGPTADEAVGAEAEAGASERFLSVLADRIAIGVASVVAVLDPGCVVLGGEIGRAGGDVLAGLVAERLRRMSPLPTEVRASGLGGSAVLRGALLTARDRAQDDLWTAPPRPPVPS
ncbi:ROK family protein [Streptomyces sp. KHY 26]|uniref:ROK family protein n=1 Tax=Streptomyces sp. KHY 26 TaxID=3097359 RepID=UPI00376F0891